ncbi:MAG: fasciclin domain-containing protein [Methanobacteriota archaeon]|nr:MAG: fasciclin domain-containing protein [Euryarchaeota archaeon]
MKDLVDVASEAGSFKTLLKAAEAAGLVSTLKGEGPLTVFAPTDEAFARLPPGTIEGLLRDREKLSAILKYHVVPGRITAQKVAEQKSLKTAQGKELAVDSTGGVKVGKARVVKTDIEASNGVIHVIDSVLLP